MLNIFRVVFRYDKSAIGGGPAHHSGSQSRTIGATNGLPATLDPILTSAGDVAPSGFVRVFEAISNHGAGTVLS